MLAALALIGAGCGSDDKSSKNDAGAKTSGTARASDNAGAAGADAFTGCFKQDGYQAISPPKGTESAFAALAKSRGFANVPINVTDTTHPAIASVFLIFFDSPSKATEAQKELKANALGEVPIAQKGSVVIAYSDKDEKTKLDAAVQGCL